MLKSVVLDEVGKRAYCVKPLNHEGLHYPVGHTFIVGNGKVARGNEWSGNIPLDDPDIGNRFFVSHDFVVFSKMSNAFPNIKFRSLNDDQITVKNIHELCRHLGTNDIHVRLAPERKHICWDWKRVYAVYQGNYGNRKIVGFTNGY
ncbi:hypothetical protein CL653_03240 [bacterium]|nr:hypothetical protein [bacterium]